MEHWVDSPQFKNHQVSTHGRIRNKKNGHILKPHSTKDGYLEMSIGNKDHVRVHKLVCETFYGPPVGDRNQVNHIDTNRQNNHVFNLEWNTISENIKWSVYKGNVKPELASMKAKEVNRKSVRIVELNKEFSSVKECADFLGVKPPNVTRCLTGERKGQKIHGYTIEYV